MASAVATGDLHSTYLLGEYLATRPYPRLRDIDGMMTTLFLARAYCLRHRTYRYPNLPGKEAANTCLPARTLRGLNLKQAFWVNPFG